MHMKKCRQMLAGAMAVLTLAASMVQGCGGKVVTQEEALAKMKDFSTVDGTVTIKMDQSWKTEDLGGDFWLAAGSENGAEAMLVMQFPKNGMFAEADTMDGVKDLVVDNYKISNSKEADVPAIPGMTNVEASLCDITLEGEKGEVYLIYGETDYAYYSLMYVANKIGDNEINAMKASCSSFVETPIEEEDNTTVELSDTVRWFGATYAILTEINGWDYNRFAGLAANDDTAEMVQQMLESSWDVTDRASADETLDWILTEGHRAEFAENGQYITEELLGDVSEDQSMVDYLLENYEVTQEEAESFVDDFIMYHEFGPEAISGWDYCRAMNLMSFYYLAGYYTEQEALDKSLEIAQTMQPLFTSWDDLIASYMRGYEYWAEESSDERQAIYEDLKTRDDNPYAVDYNMTLEKTW